MKYNPQKIEQKWQKEWEKNNLYRADDKSKKPKYYQLETFPYPSAAGLHVGHPKGYIAEDIHARYMRMNGKEVLYTMGWDAFGLPTENYAIKVGKSPQVVADANIKNFKRQVKMFGLSYDWDREINTSSPDYYKWTQWLFIQLFNAGLAYRKTAMVNWCPKDQTVLANEQVVDGKCERDGEPVVQKEMEQWFLKITDYTERLLSGLEGLDWPEATIKRQKDWIGKSEGALINFRIADSSEAVEVFTTRPDTIFGATYMVLAPEHELVSKIKNRIANIDEVEKYIEQAKRKTELQRKEEEKGKTGVELKGVKAINPATKEEIPVWIADYVLAGYGTGAIMAVPAHDERDAEFAKKFNLPFSDAALADSGQVIKRVDGVKKIQYKLRDWSVSRQRYWGVPVPMIHCSDCALRYPSGQGIVPVLEKDLPVKLPPLKDYRPKGKPPLASSDKFIKVRCPKCGGEATRDSETLDTFVDSSWYYLRYTDPKNDSQPFDKTRVNHWMPVDLYVIGAEHTVLHLLYSRFITKFLHDQGYLDFDEPFLKLRHVGLILGEDGQKMSKSRGNVVNPDDLVDEVGADTLRLYEMFMGPFEDGQPWDPKSIAGVSRFLNRTWSFFNNTEIGNGDENIEKSVHKAIKKVGKDIENLRFNTSVSELMKLLNEMDKQHQISVFQAEAFLKILAPFAPHLAEEIWRGVLGRKESIHLEKWPEYNPDLVVEQTASIVVQINGKARAVVSVPSGSNEEYVAKVVMKEAVVAKYLKDNVIKKTVFVKDRLINFVL